MSKETHKAWVVKFHKPTLQMAWGVFKAWISGATIVIKTDSRLTTIYDEAKMLRDHIEKVKRLTSKD